MDDPVSFGSREYFLMLALLVFARGADFLSTWVATPHLVLEGNPIAKKLGWKWGAVVNAAVCGALAFWPVAAITVATASVLVAARNFQSAWLMRTMGEQAYREWYVDRIQETPIPLSLLCLAGNTLLTAGVGVAVIYFGDSLWVPVAIGMGIIAYAAAVALYTLLALWRIWHAQRLRWRRTETDLNGSVRGRPLINGEFPEALAGEEARRRGPMV